VVNEATSENVIIVVPGAADAMVPDDLDAAEAGIANPLFSWHHLKFRFLSCTRTGSSQKKWSTHHFKSGTSAILG
jgi:hypothetical protein